MGTSSLDIDWNAAVRWHLLILVLSTSVAVAGDTIADLEGRPIVRIVVDRHNIFDTDDENTSGWAYRAANSMHLVSREGFIRSMLLFAEGDPYSADLAEESARLLRGLGLMEPVYITAEDVEGGVEVRVETHDRWTLHASVDFSLQGNRSDFGVRFKEQNFLGYGLELRTRYSSDEERDSIEFGFIDPNVRGSRWRVALLYADTSDGFEQRARVERPFYSLDTTRAWGGEWLDWQLDEFLYAGSDARVTGRVDRRGARAWWGFRVSEQRRTTRRLTVGFDARETRFTDWRWVDDDRPYRPPEDRTVAGPRLTYEQIADRFVVLRAFRGWKAQEDVALGPNLNLGATVSAPVFGGDRSRVLLDGQASIRRRAGQWIVLGDVIGEGRIEDGGLVNGVLGVQFGAVQLGERGWQFRLRADVSRELDENRQLTLGTDVGLRGWSPDTFDGSSRAVVNLQWRRQLVEDLFEVATLGVVVFADAGQTWSPRIGPGTDGVRTDIGVGMLGDLSRIGIASLLRLEVALPDDGSGVTVTLTSSSLF
jgi:hypothetical protein